MNIYVAARFYEKDEVRRIYSLLTSRGHSITTDWTLHKNIKPYNEHPDMAREYAVEDVEGVKRADVLIFLTSEQTGSGTSTELGVAIVHQQLTGKPTIYVVGLHTAHNFAYFHPAVTQVATIDDVLAEL